MVLAISQGLHTCSSFLISTCLFERHFVKIFVTREVFRSRALSLSLSLSLFVGLGFLSHDATLYGLSTVVTICLSSLFLILYTKLLLSVSW